MTSSDNADPGEETPRRDEARPDTPGAAALVVVDLAVVRLGVRASWLLDHRPVFNDQGEEIGHIDDLVLEDERVTYVIIGVGGFLGVGERKVALPYSSLHIDDRIVLPGATREALKALPDLGHDA
jgi:sporulation protein YlmC with PRC-barrel domain